MPRKFSLMALVIACSILLCGCQPDIPHISGTAYFVDCATGNDTHPGTSSSKPWKSLDRVNAAQFAPGDGIFFQRGTTCSGTLQPQGSGSDGKPIIIGAYGHGNRPVIDGGKNQATVLLSHQQYWHIQDIEITGATVFGLYITGAGKGGILNHFRLTNLIVHDVYGGQVRAKESGLVVFSTGGENTTFNDVVVESVTAYNTNQWGGIIIAGLSGDYRLDPPVLSTHITVRNAIVHDVFGDGIVLWGVKDGLIEKSVAYETGQQPSPQTIGTPNAIWTWMCHDCIVQNNEAYRTHSPGKDGGAFDVDWGSKNNVYQYNYAHDTDSYCLSVFGAGGLTTSNSIIRYNLCANNGLDTSKAINEGALYMSTWDRGDLDGVQIYNNTFIWNPAINAPLLNNQATFRGTQPSLFANNVIVSGVPWLIYTNASISLDHNLYWHPGDQSPVMMYGAGIYKSFAEYQRGSQQDKHSQFSDPKLSDATYHGIGKPAAAFTLLAGSPAINAGADVCSGIKGCSMGARDFSGSAAPYGGAYDVGALESRRAAGSQANTLGVLTTPVPTFTPQAVQPVSQVAAAVGMVGPEFRSLSNQSCRMVLRLSVSGDSIRIRLSNLQNPDPVTFDQVYAGIRTAGAGSAANIPLTFSGATRVTIPAGQEITSDRVALSVHAQQDIVVTVYLAGEISRWVYGVTKSASVSTYCTDRAGGNRAAETSGEAFVNPLQAIGWLSAVDVYSTAATGSVVVIGDSIADGVGSTLDGHDRWTDVLMARMSRATPSKPLANVSIPGGTCVNVNGWGPTVLDRLDRDVFSQSNVSHVILEIGTNDLAKNTTSDELVKCLQIVISQAHARGLKILIGTIIPLDRSKNNWWTSAMETNRQEVNTWIRNNAEFLDGLLDFDAVVRDPAIPDRFKAEYDCGDGMHPGPAGHAAMGNSIDLALLEVTASVGK